jgi:hypothetical protein
VPAWGIQSYRLGLAKLLLSKEFVRGVVYCLEGLTALETLRMVGLCLCSCICPVLCHVYV